MMMIVCQAYMVMVSVASLTTLMTCSGFQNECNVTANLLSLEAFNGTESIIELEARDEMTPGADQVSAALETILSSP